MFRRAASPAPFEPEIERFFAECDDIYPHRLEAIYHHRGISAFTFAVHCSTFSAGQACPCACDHSAEPSVLKEFIYQQAPHLPERRVITLFDCLLRELIERDPVADHLCPSFSVCMPEKWRAEGRASQIPCMLRTGLAAEGIFYLKINIGRGYSPLEAFHVIHDPIIACMLNHFGHYLRDCAGSGGFAFFQKGPDPVDLLPELIERLFVF